MQKMCSLQNRGLHGDRKYIHSIRPVKFHTHLHPSPQNVHFMPIRPRKSLFLNPFHSHLYISKVMYDMD